MICPQQSLISCGTRWPKDAAEEDAQSLWNDTLSGGVNSTALQQARHQAIQAAAIMKNDPGGPLGVLIMK